MFALEEVEYQDKKEGDKKEVDEGGGKHPAGDRGADGILAPAPAPVAMASGRTPKKKASEVMTIGRNRNLAASRVASISPAPCIIRCSGELNNQDGVFGREP